MEAGTDPGENWFVVRPGPLIGARLEFEGERSDIRPSYSLELSFTGGGLPKTHTHPPNSDFFGQGARITPAGNLGLEYTPRSLSGSDATAVYAEVQVSRTLVGVAGGWRWVPTTGDTGPQVTGFFGPFFARANYHIGGSSSVQLGIVIKAELAWVWSR